MNDYQEIVRINFGDYDPHLYRCIIKALEGCTDHHDALRKLYGLIDRIEHLTDVLSGVGATKPELGQSPSQPSH